MKLILFFFFFFSFSFSIYADKIATFEISKVIENVSEYKTFQKELESYRVSLFENLSNEEKQLIEEKKTIEESKILLSDDEFKKRVDTFNSKSEIFKKKVEKFNNVLQQNIDINERKIIEEIATIVKQIAKEYEISLVFTESQYYLTSDNLSITDIIIERINQKSLNFEILKFDYE